MIYYATISKQQPMISVKICMINIIEIRDLTTYRATEARARAGERGEAGGQRTLAQAQKRGPGLEKGDPPRYNNMQVLK